ncbi:MAG: hypothetical protein ACYDHP_13965 [Ferrimicrobium sp.]
MPTLLGAKLFAKEARSFHFVDLASFRRLMRLMRLIDSKAQWRCKDLECTSPSWSDVDARIAHFLATVDAIEHLDGLHDHLEEMDKVSHRL